MVRRAKRCQRITAIMVDKLFSEYSSKLFIDSTLNLVDDALYLLRDEDNDALTDAEHSMGPVLFAKEFRTVGVRCRRRMGHTHLINQLAYDLKTPIGRRYSTLVITQKRMMAEEMYGIQAAYYDPPEQYEAMQQYAAEYNNYMRSIPSPYHFLHGKIATVGQVSAAGFKTTEFVTQNKQTITALTDIDMTNKKIDLLCIDVAGMLTKDDIENIYMHFSTHVELFLLLE